MGKLLTKLVPKQQWLCDSCGEIIEKAEDGWLEWKSDSEPDYQESDFRIVHHDRNCMYDQKQIFLEENKLVSDTDLKDFTEERGLINIMAFIESGRLKDLHEFAEITRRLHTPYYEEARSYWRAAEKDGFFEGANEVWPYMPETSILIITKYGD